MTETETDMAGHQTERWTDRRRQTRESEREIMIQADMEVCGRDRKIAYRDVSDRVA